MTSTIRSESKWCNLGKQAVAGPEPMAMAHSTYARRSVISLSLDSLASEPSTLTKPGVCFRKTEAPWASETRNA